MYFEGGGAKSSVASVWHIQSQSFLFVSEIDFTLWPVQGNLSVFSVQRFADIAPTGLLHKTVCETTIAGYSLPANTLVLANFSACHRNPKHFSDPDRFNPENFLENGKLITDKEGFLPYGIGPRICPGAELADMQLFLMMSNLMTVYSLAMPEGDTGETGTQFEAGTSVLRNPKPYRVIFMLRE